MIVKEFEGKNEKEAIDRAIEELGLDRNEIDFEIVEAKRPGILFRGGKVKIRVHLAGGAGGGRGGGRGRRPGNRAIRRRAPLPAQAPLRGQRRVRGQGHRLHARAPGPDGLSRRGHGELPRGRPAGPGHRERRLGNPHRQAGQDPGGAAVHRQPRRRAHGRRTRRRIVLDTQDYRSRRERSLIRMANQVAEQVRRSRESQLLEPLNPFERRLIHTSLARYGDIETVSEGDGLYKRIRVIWRGDRDGASGVSHADLRVRVQGMQELLRAPGAVRHADRLPFLRQREGREEAEPVRRAHGTACAGRVPACHTGECGCDLGKCGSGSAGSSEPADL